jgi:DNA-binding response OmpR family regulator
MPPKVLIVDDERKIVHGLAGYFRQAGFEPLSAYNGRAAFEIARREQPDAIILDAMLPEIDGFELCRRLRAESDVPILMLTARVEEADRLQGLDLGADDYIVKPFSPREVVARTRAVLRRASGALAPGRLLKHDPIEVDLERLTVCVNGSPVSLTPTEYNLLVALMRRPGMPFSRSQLLEILPEDGLETFDRTVDAHIKNLRRKIEPNPARPQLIMTVYGVGYKFAG